MVGRMDPPNPPIPRDEGSRAAKLVALLAAVGVPIFVADGLFGSDHPWLAVRLALATVWSALAVRMIRRRLPRATEQFAGRESRLLNGLTALFCMWVPLKLSASMALSADGSLRTVIGIAGFLLAAAALRWFSSRDRGSALPPAPSVGERGHADDGT